MTRLARTWRLARMAAGTALREKLAFRANFVGSMLTYGLFVVIFSRIWSSAMAEESAIAGYSYTMMVWYFIFAEIPLFALGRFFWTISRDMKSGQIAYQLARPYDLVSYQFYERIGSALPELAILLVEGLVIGLLLTGGLPPLDGALGMAASARGLWLEALRLLTVLLSLGLSGVLNFHLQFSLAMTAFWLEENDAFFWIYQKLSLVVGTLLPIEFLPGPAQALAVWTPFPYIAYAPARMMVAFNPAEAAGLLAGQLVWIGLAIGLSRLVFAAGVRRVAVNGG